MSVPHNECTALSNLNGKVAFGAHLCFSDENVENTFLGQNFLKSMQVSASVSFLCSIHCI